MMKPLVIVLDTFPSLSEIFLYNTIENLQASGLAIKIFARKRGCSFHQIPFGTEVRYLPSERTCLLAKLWALIFYGLKLLLYSPHSALTTFQFLQKKYSDLRQRSKAAYRILPLLCCDADLIYLPFGGLAVKYLDLFELGSPISFSLRGTDIRIEPLVNPEYARSLQKAMQKARRIHCVSEDIKRDAIRLSGLDAEKFQVIYTSVNPVLLNESTHAASNGPLKIVSTGRLDWKKGLEHGMMAVAELQKRGVACTWEIVGDGPYRTALEWAARDLGLQDVVVFAGAKKHEEVIQYLNQSDVLFHPSVSEGLSNSVLEGMAAGLPVVVSDVGGMAEAVEDGVHGFLTPPRDWRAMADSLERLAKDPALRQRMAQAGQAQVREKFTPQKQMAGFQKFFLSAQSHD